MIGSLYRMQWEAVVTLPVDELIDRYYRPEHLLPLCRACPNYGKNYACPPLAEDMLGILRRFPYIHLHVARLYLSESIEPQQVQWVFDQGMILLNERLLDAEAKEKGSLAISPGTCKICSPCARERGEPCLYPHQMRLSLDAFSLEIAQMTKELCQLEIQWYKDTPPAYLTMMGGLLSMR